MDQQPSFDDDSFWNKVRDFAAKVPFAADAIAMYFALRDPRTPFKHKAVILGALAYWIDPFDAVPDFIVAAGQLDDLTTIAAALFVVRKSVTAEHMRRARGILGQENPPEEQP